MGKFGQVWIGSVALLSRCEKESRAPRVMSAWSLLVDEASGAPYYFDAATEQSHCFVHTHFTFSQLHSSISGSADTPAASASKSFARIFCVV